MPDNLYWQHLTAGLHLAGGNGATSFPDVKGHSFYRTGAVAISTAQSRFAGEGSAYFPGATNDLLKCDAHADFGGATNSLSIAFSIYPLSFPPSGQEARVVMVGENGSTGSFFVSLTSSGILYFGIAAGGTNATGTADGEVVLNTWQDFEVSAFNGNMVILRNRVLVGARNGQTMPTGSYPKRVQIGGDNSGFPVVDARYHGYLSEVQIQALHGRMLAALAPTGPFSETLAPGVAAAPPAPVACIRSVAPPHRILRQGVPELAKDTENGGHGRVIGTTKNVGTPNYPVSRRVRLLRKRDGVLAREVWSDTAGNYLFDKVRHDREYVVMAHDHTGLYNAVVADTVTPELIS